MSVIQRLRNSGVVDNDRTTVQRSNGTTTFRIAGIERGATIYVPRGDRHFAIITSTLENGHFPNNERLYAFVRRNGRPITTGGGAYRLGGQNIGRAIELIREGLDE